VDPGRAVDKVGKNGGVLSQQEAGCECCEKLRLQSDEECWPATPDHARCLRRVHHTVRELKVEDRLPWRVRMRSRKYLNNMIEQDHRRIKQRTRPMLGFKRFDYAAVSIRGIELIQKIQKY